MLSEAGLLAVGGAGAGVEAELLQSANRANSLKPRHLARLMSLLRQEMVLLGCLLPLGEQQSLVAIKSRAVMQTVTVGLRVEQERKILQMHRQQHL